MSANAPDIEVEWGPAIDAGACTGCGTCRDLCHNDVYRWADDHSRVAVGYKAHCMPGCSLRRTMRVAGDLVPHHRGAQAAAGGGASRRLTVAG